MNLRKVSEDDYIKFMIGSPRQYSCCEAERVSTQLPGRPSHDSWNRLLTNLEPDAGKLWEEVKAYVNRGNGILVLDDSTLDKPYSQKNRLVSYHWSGKHQEVVKGINLVSLVWSDEEYCIPCDYRIYQKENGMTRNDHFKSMLNEAKQRGMKPRYVLFDSWYASLDNLKLVRNLDWRWVTRLQANRTVNPDGSGQIALSEMEIGHDGSIAYLKGYGLVKVFRMVAKDGDVEYWASSDHDLTDLQRLKLADQAWSIENYHRDLKQNTGVERCQLRSIIGQKNHIGFSIRAFFRMRIYRVKKGISRFAMKWNVIRDAVAHFMAVPFLWRSTA